MRMHQKLILEESGLNGLRRGLRGMREDFAEGRFLPNSYLDVFAYQRLFVEVREHLELRYGQFKAKTIYRDCMEHLGLLEHMIYLKNPEGGLN